VRSTNKPLWITGLSAMVASSVWSLFLVFSTGDAVSLIPLAGPFLFAGKVFPGSVRYSSSVDLVITAASVASGVAQLVGGACLVFGLTNRAVWLEREAGPQVSLVLTPTGAQVRGSF
jgi:hypothetical protein